MTRHRIFGIPFADIYPHYVTKAQKKGYTVADLHTVLEWLTGYDEAGLRHAVAEGTDLRGFFDQAPAMHPNTALITGVICGHRVEDIEDPLMQKVRYLDKLVDEVARGKKMSSILRGEAATAF